MLSTESVSGKFLAKSLCQSMRLYLCQSMRLCVCACVRVCVRQGECLMWGGPGPGPGVCTCASGEILSAHKMLSESISSPSWWASLVSDGRLKSGHGPGPGSGSKAQRQGLGPGTWIRAIIRRTGPLDCWAAGVPQRIAVLVHASSVYCDVWPHKSVASHLGLCPERRISISTFPARHRAPLQASC
jgi:hypothetical protein